MAEYTRYSDVLVNVYSSEGVADRVGFNSVYATESHPGTGTKISGFRWDERTWPAQDELPEDRFVPTFYDPVFSATSDSDWQSGIGDGDDLKVLRIEREYVKVNPSGEVWAPYINHGYVYSSREEFYLHSEGLKTEYFDSTLDAGGFQQMTLSGELKPTTPVVAYQREYDSDTNTWSRKNDFRKRYDFTPLAVSGEYYDIRDDSDDLLHDNVDTSSPEFIIQYLDSGETTQLTLNGNYLLGNEESLLLSGVTGWCEYLGTSDGSAYQSYKFKYSPLLDSGVHVYVYSGTASPVEWSIETGEVPELTTPNSGCLVDYDWGTVSFGDSFAGIIPPLGYRVAVQYTSTVGVDYEIDNSPDYYIAKSANLNVTRGQPTEGFITTETQQVSAASLRLSANLDQLAENLYSPLNIGSTHTELEALVYGQNGEVLAGQEVTFYISGFEVGAFSAGDSTAISSTGPDGRARAFFVPPTSIEDLGDASATTAYDGSNTTVLFSGLHMPYSGAQLYTFKVMNSDTIDGMPVADLSDYYEDYFDEEEISYTALADETDKEGAYRNAYDLLTPTTYAAGDLKTGNKRAVLIYDYSAIDPDTGTAGAYNLLDPLSYSWTQSGVAVLYSGNLEAPSSLTDFRSYFVASPTLVKFKAFTWSEHLGRNVYSNEITVRIEIPDNMSGVYAVDAIESVQSGVLNRWKTHPEISTSFTSLIDGGVFSDSDFELAFLLEREPSTETRESWFQRTRRSDTVLLGLEDVSTAETGAFEVPLGFRLRNSSATMASAVGAVTFLDANAGNYSEVLPLGTVHSTVLNPFVISIGIVDGASLFLLWGDGTSTQLTDDAPATDYTDYDNTYSVVGRYPLRLVGELDKVTTIVVSAESSPGVNNLVFETDLAMYKRFSAMVGTFGVIAPAYLTGEIEVLDEFDAALDTIALLSDSPGRVTGDLEHLARFTQASAIYCGALAGEDGGWDATYTGTSLPAWDSALISLANCSLTSAEVDNILIQLDAAGGTNGTISLASSGPYANGARTSASDAAAAALVVNGWTVSA